PDFEKTTLKHDLTVLILEQCVPAATALPRPLATPGMVAAAKDVVVVGFGAEDEDSTRGFGLKRQAESAIASLGCDAVKNNVNDADAYGCHAGRELVAEDPLRQKDTCKGDSGGPAYVLHLGKWYLAAATSRPSKKNELRDCGDGGIYVRIDKYSEWIIKTAQENGGIMP